MNISKLFLISSVLTLGAPAIAARDEACLEAVKSAAVAAATLMYGDDLTHVSHMAEGLPGESEENLTPNTYMVDIESNEADDRFSVIVSLSVKYIEKNSCVVEKILDVDGFF